MAVDNDHIVIGAGPLNEYFALWRLKFWRNRASSVYEAPDFSMSSKPSPDDYVLLDGEYGKVNYIDWEHEEVKVYWFKRKESVSYDLDLFIEYEHARGSYKRTWKL